MACSQEGESAAVIRKGGAPHGILTFAVALQMPGGGLSASRDHSL